MDPNAFPFSGGGGQGLSRAAAAAPVSAQAAASASGMCHSRQEPQSSQAFGQSGAYGGGWLVERGEHGRPEIQICSKPSFISLASYFEKAIIISKAFTVHGGCAG